ncbi:hypothetical protein D1007_32385 [Hordeum vulgare]|nr:hypothetical protein D1007_32385 [Hordeum vulgare]
MAKAAASLLPGLLPTPPSRPCLIILPASFNPKSKPGRADSVERWDAHKSDKKPRSPASSSRGTSSPERASSCERWDIRKKIPSSSSSSSSSSTSSSSSSSRGSSSRSGGVPSCGRWDSNKSLADRWDTHKKPRPVQTRAESWRNDKEEQEDETMPRIGPMFSGPSFVASPDPSMLPMSAFFLSRNPGVGDCCYKQFKADVASGVLAYYTKANQKY